MSNFYFAVNSLNRTMNPFHRQTLAAFPELMVNFICGVEGRQYHDDLAGPSKSKAKAATAVVQSRAAVGKTAWGALVALLQVLFDKHVRDETPEMTVNHQRIREKVDLERWVETYQVSCSCSICSVQFAA